MKNKEEKTSISVSIALLLICYFFGYHLQGAYDGVNDYKDVISICSGVGVVGWLFYRIQ